MSEWFECAYHALLTMQPVRDLGEQSSTIVRLPNIMAKFVEPDRAVLQRIADALGVPIDRFFADSSSVDDKECLRLLFSIKTEKGRCRAIEALKKIVDDESS